MNKDGVADLIIGAIGANSAYVSVRGSNIGSSGTLECGEFTWY